MFKNYQGETMKTLKESWKEEWKKHSGDYDLDAEEDSLFIAYKAGWLASKRNTLK